MLGHLNLKNQHLPGWHNTAEIGYTNIEAVGKTYVVIFKGLLSNQKHIVYTQLKHEKRKSFNLKKKLSSIYSGDCIHFLFSSFQIF